MIYRVRKGIRIHALDSADETEFLCGRSAVGGHIVRIAQVGITCEGCNEALRGPRFSLCETVTAASTSTLHIRLLTGRGMLLSGSADTPALCGQEVEWDVLGDPEDEAVRRSVCRNCLRVWRQTVARLS